MKEEIPNSCVTLDGNLIFKFYDDNNGECDRGVDYCVMAEIFWKSAPEETETLVIPSGSTTYFNKQYSSGGYVYGDFDLQILDMDGGEVGFKANIRYGHHGASDEHHFEGIMVTFTEDGSPHPSPLPEPDCEIPLDPSEPFKPIVNNHSEELFPYVYVRKWPKIGANDLEFNFIQYCVPSPPTDSFYADLCSKRVDGREKMETMAVNFIEGNSSYTRKFISQMDGLKGIICSFPEIYERLAFMDSFILTDMITEIESITSKQSKEITQYLETDEYLAEKDRVWQSYFALVIISGYDESLLNSFIEILTVCHLMEAAFPSGSESSDLSDEVLQQLLEASIVLPDEIFPLPPVTLSPPVSESSSGWIEPYSIGDLQMVRQRSIKYVPGEVAYIENIMRGERKEKSRRKTTRTEDRHESASIKDVVLVNEARDERNSLLEEIKNAIAAKSLTKTYTDFDANYGPPTQAKLNGSWNRKTDPRTNIDDITRFARDILNKTVNQISHKVSSTRSSSVLNESEDIEKSVIDNSDGDKNLICVFRWLNRVFEAQVVNYGSRLMIEFMIEDPAAKFIRREKEVEGSSYSRPLPPEKNGITSYQSITVENYAELAACYQVTDITAPPIRKKYVCTTLRVGQETQLSIPTGYRVVNAYVKGFLDGLVPSVLVGRQLITPGSEGKLGDYGEDITIPIAVMDDGIKLSPPTQSDAMVNIEVCCAVSVATMNEWKIMMYGAIMKAYQAQLSDYLSLTRESGHSPARSAVAARSIVHKEVKRGCTDILFNKMCSMRGWSVHNFQEVSSFSVNEPRYLQFFDEALEWNEMTSTLYEGREDDLAPDYNGEEGSFAEFLDSKLARVLIPVRPGLSMKFLYFLSSGMLWPNSDALTPVNQSELALINDLKKLRNQQSSEQCIGEPWEVITPTALQIVEQKNDCIL